MMGAILRFAFLLSLGVSMAAIATADSEDAPAPSNLNLEEFKNLLNSILNNLGQGLAKLQDLVKRVKEFVTKIENDEEGNLLLAELKKASDAASEPLYENPQKRCDTVPEDLEPIHHCLGCDNGKWTVIELDYSVCKTNAADNAKYNSLFLLLPLILVVFFR